jgi:uncharacterized membrane protein (DUF2068 family)
VSAPADDAPARPLGLRIIIAYKLARALLQLAAAGVLFAHESFSPTALPLTWALETKRHLGHHFWQLIARALAAGAHHLTAIALGLTLDASIALFEVFALLRGYRWASWLVVVTTSVPLPWEAVEIVRHPHPTRFLLLLVNLGVVAYLASRARRHAAAD